MTQRSTRIQQHRFPHCQPGTFRRQPLVRLAQPITRHRRQRYHRRDQQRPAPIGHRALPGEHNAAISTPLLILWR